MHDNLRMHVCTDHPNMHVSDQLEDTSYISAGSKMHGGGVCLSPF